MGSFNKNQDIDVILPVFNNYKTTKECIDSIFNSVGHSFKLIIVDDFSTEKELFEYYNNLEKDFKNILIIRKKKNEGVIKTINLGIEKSTSEIIVVINKNVIFHKNWMNELEQGFNLDKNIGIIGPIVGISNKTRPDEIEINEELEIENQLKFTDVNFVSSPYMLIKKEVIRKCKVFDVIFGRNFFYSDMDFCFRAKNKGFKILALNSTSQYYSDPPLNESDNLGLIYEKSINYTLFKRKWGKSVLFRSVPEEIKLKEIIRQDLKVDCDGFYYNHKLKKNHKLYLLVNPSVVDTKELFTLSHCTTPTGILRIANFLINQGHKINFYDFEPYSKENKRKKIDLRSKRDLFIYGKPFNDFCNYLKNIPQVDEIFITTIMTYHYPHLGELVDIIKEKHKNARITIGGIYASLCSEEIKKLNVDVHIGSYFGADSYRPLVEITNEKKMGVLRIVRGCPHKCSYCAVSNIEGSKIVNFSIEEVISQFQEYFSLGTKLFMFWDSNILFAKKTLFELLDYIIDYGYSKLIYLDFSYGLEFDLIDDILIEKLKKVRLHNPLIVPLESSEYELYETRFKKPSNHLEIIKRKVLKLQDEGIDNLAFYVLAGLPGQTLNQVLNTIIFGLRLHLYPLIMPFTPIPKTKEFKDNYNLIKNKELWELNPYLFPCSSKELSEEDMMTMLYSFHAVLVRDEMGDLPDDEIIFTKSILSKKNRVSERFRELLYPERIDPEIHKQVIGLESQIGSHVSRYFFINKSVFGDVLDIGCGTGYGINSLSSCNKVSNLIGVDISEDAINYAKQNYSNPKTKFICGDVNNFNYDYKFDNIIIFEVIEHLKEPEQLLDKAKKLLKKNGTMYLSTPLSASYSIKPENPHHVKEYTYEELYGLLSKSFEVTFFGQNGGEIELLKKGKKYETAIIKCQFKKLGFFDIKEHANVSHKIINLDNFNYLSEYFNVIKLEQIKENEDLNVWFKTIINKKIKHVLLNDVFDPINLFKYRKENNLDVNFIIYPYIFTNWRKRFVELAKYVKSSDVVICFSEFLKKRFEEISRKYQTFFMPVAFDYDSFKHTTKNNKELNLVCCARMCPEKGLNILIEALNKIQKEHQFKLHIISPVLDLDEKGKKYFFLIKGLIKEYGLGSKVIFYDSLSDDQKRRKEIMSNSDALIYLTTDPGETFGRIVVEAFAAGLVVITTNWQSVNELVVENENGFIISVDKENKIDIRDVVVAIKNLYNSELLSKIKELNIIKAKNYDYGVHIERLRKRISIQKRDHAIYIRSLNDLELVDSARFDRIYFGCEFCEKLIPTEKEINKLLEFNKQNNISLTLTTPWCTDNGVNNLSQILPLLPKKTEVVFNDWGVLKLIKKNNLIPVLGRLLVSIKRDPRVDYSLKQFDYFKQSNIDNKDFQNFLVSQGILRIELDNVIQGYNFELINKLTTSLHYPFVYITTAKKCITAKCDNINYLSNISKDCKFECGRYTFLANLKESKHKIILKGNSQFYKNDKKPESLNNWSVDRLVYTPKLPFNFIS